MPSDQQEKAHNDYQNRYFNVDCDAICLAKYRQAASADEERTGYEGDFVKLADQERKKTCDGDPMGPHPVAAGTISSVVSSHPTPHTNGNE